MSGVLSAMEISKSFSVRALLVLLAIYARFNADGSQLQNMVDIRYIRYLSQGVS